MLKSGIEVKVEYMPMAFLLSFCTPVIEINGQKNPRKWGRHTFELQPGDYTVKVYFPYMLMAQCGANEVKFTLLEGQQRRITFDAPAFIFSKGTMTIS